MIPIATNTMSPQISLPSIVIGVKLPYPTVHAVSNEYIKALLNVWITGFTECSASQRAYAAVNQKSSKNGHSMSGRRRRLAVGAAEIRRQIVEKGIQHVRRSFTH